MPDPRPETETRDEWIERCMSDSESMKDFPDEDQRFAFCASRWTGAVGKAVEDIDLTPTQEMADVASRALEWRSEFGRGGTEVGVARARDISNRSRLSPDTVGRMVSYFARHEVDKQAEGFSDGEEGFPSAGRIAWDLWGGDPGKSWAERKQDQIEAETMSDNQYFEVKLQDVTVREQDEAGNEIGEIEGIGAVFGNVDGGRDVIEYGAFSKSLAEKNGAPVPMLWQHNFAEPIGSWKVVHEFDHGLRIKGRFNMNVARGREAFHLTKDGDVTGLSIGYKVRDFEIDLEKQVRRLKELDLGEISIVTFPMNTAARISGVKSIFDCETPRQVEQRLRSHGLTQREAKCLAGLLQAQRDAGEVEEGHAQRDAGGEKTEAALIKELRAFNAKISEIGGNNYG